MDASLADFARIVGPENFFDDPVNIIANTRSVTRSGEPLRVNLPLAAARPTTLGQCAELIKLCGKRGYAACFRGSGAGDSPRVDKPYITLLTGGLDRLLKIDAAGGRARVMAGVTGAAFTRALARAGLRLPTVLAAAATLGGIAAVNAASRAIFKYGTLINYIESLEIVSGAGERILCHNYADACGAGFSLAPLFCGSRGEFGLIGVLEFRLLPTPQSSFFSLARFEEFEGAAVAIKALLESRLAPASMEIFDNRSGAATTLPPLIMLALEFDGAREEAEKDLAMAEDILAKSGCREIARDPGAWPITAANLPATLAASGRLFKLISATFPPSALPEFARGLDMILREKGLTAVTYGYPGAASLEIALFYADAKVAEDAAGSVFALELALNDREFNEADLTREREEFGREREERAKVRACLKKIFDPDGVLSHAEG